MDSMKVKNCSLVRLGYFDDSPDGSLFIAESNRSVPIKIRRVFFINNLAHQKAVRGKHAHKKLEQVILCINGSFLLELDDGETKQEILMDDPSVGVLMGRLVWLTMTNFSKECVILVLASDFFNEKDYVRDYDKFLRLTRKHGK